MNNMENIETTPDDSHSPCVRAFVANFERHDSTSGVGNENRPPVVTKSKVALLRQTLGKSSDSVKRSSSDNLSDSGVKIHEAADTDATTDSTEHIVSVAKLKENLQKSASEKRVAPWGFGGSGRPVKEPKKPASKQTDNFKAEADTKSVGNGSPPKVVQTTKCKSNNSFKRSQENLLEFRSQNLDETVSVGNSVKVSEVTNPSDALRVQFNRSSSTGENLTGEKHKTAPKVLPKPASRKAKANLISVSHERSQSDDKCERTAYQNKNAAPGSSSSMLLGKELGSREPLPRSPKSCDRSDSLEILRTDITEIVVSSDESRKTIHSPSEINQAENTSMSKTEEAHTIAKKPHDIESAAARNTEDSDGFRFTCSDKLQTDGHTKTYDIDLVHTTDTSNAVPLAATRTDCVHAFDSTNSDFDDEKADDASIDRGSVAEVNNRHLVLESLTNHHMHSEGTSVEEIEHASGSVSLDPTTDLVISDDESLADANWCSKTDDDDSVLPLERRIRTPDEDVMHGIDSISLVQKSSRASDDNPENCNTIELASDEPDNIPSAENSSFLRSMGPDFIAEIKELSLITAEEQDYEALAAVVCCKMCEQEEESVCWLLCPPDTYRSTVDYVGSLFKDDSFMGVAERKVSTWTAEESSFMSSDSLRELLLDKATKKLERLKFQKQKLDAIEAKQVKLEELMDSVVKDKVDSRQYSKYRSTVEEFDRVTHLLLMLASRLANTDNSLDQISFSDNERQKALLITKRENLIEKFEEACSIKETSETRQMQLAECLQRHLGANEFLNYQQLMKTVCQLKLLRHSLEDRVSLSEEQIRALVAVIEKNTSAKYC